MARPRPAAWTIAVVAAALLPVAGVTGTAPEASAAPPEAAHLSTAPAGPGTSADVRTDDGRAIGLATFRPSHRGGGSPARRPASFEVIDLSCGDGVVVGLYYAVDGGPQRRWEPADDACPASLPWRNHEVPVAVRGVRVDLVRWWAYARDLGERDPRWGSDVRRDLTSILAPAGNTRRSRRAGVLRAPVC